MKIMNLIFSYYTGGIERLITDISNEMVNDHEMYLYIINDQYSKEMLETLDPRVKVILYKRKSGLKGKIQSVLDLTKFIRKEKIDIVHCNMFNTPDLLFLKSLCFKHTRVIQTIHDVHQFDGLSTKKISYRNKICDQFIAISECVKKDMIQAGIDKNKITVVYNAINLNKFKYQPQESSSMIIGNVARFMPEKKGQDLLVEAMKQIVVDYPESKCLFAGGVDEGHQEAYQNLTQLIEAEHLEHNIQFLGNVEDVPAFLNNVNLFVLPSRYEGFGISLIEAMSMGIPVIASNIDGPKELLTKYPAGLLFENNNSEDLALKIKEVLSHYKYYQQNSIQLVNKVRTDFDIKNMCQTLESLYMKA